MKITNRSFFAVSASELAKRLLGKILCAVLPDGNILKKRIVETEAYGGFDEPDTASHAFCGKTQRNAPMFEMGGTIYIYLCYGIYNILNIVSGQRGDPQGVMIRGVEGAIGPGKVGRLFELSRLLSGSDIVGNNTLWLEDDNFAVKNSQIKLKQRIGINYASESDKSRLARFCLETKPNE